MNDREIFNCLQGIGWQEHYTNDPYVKYYRFKVPTSKGGWEYFYLDRSNSNAKLCLHPRFLDWRNDLRGYGVELGGANGNLILKSADMLEFPRSKGRTGDDIPEFFPLQFSTKEALLNALTVITEKAGLENLAIINNNNTSSNDSKSKFETKNFEETKAPESMQQRSLSEDELLDILNRQRENGANGELIAIEWEKNRLRSCGCSVPEDFVIHTAKVNVAAGYDIHSNWNLEEDRFIEVKTTASRSKEFFMSENEKLILEEKSGKSFIYIVDLDSSGSNSGLVRETIKFDLDMFEFEPVAYRVRIKQ